MSIDETSMGEGRRPAGSSGRRKYLPVSMPSSSVLVARVTSAVLVLGAMLAVWSTARIFSGTVDEPAHLAAGMQWLTTHRYDYDIPHPPLGRAAAAIGPYRHGARGTGADAIYDEGARILGSGEHYRETLASARHGEIVFLALLGIGVWLWGRRLLGENGAVLATLLAMSDPNVLAHAGLATTDIACAAGTTLALYFGLRWLEHPTRRRAALFGLTLGIAISSRFSAIAFVGASLVAWYMARGLVARRWRMSSTPTAGQSIANLATLLGCCAVVIWAAYRFAVGRMQPGGALLPAPAFVLGVSRFLLHGESGHPSFLLGTSSNHGWWYYFPVATLVKVPLPILALAAAGAITTLRRMRAYVNWVSAAPILAALAMLAVSMTVKVDLGIRLVLPMLPMLAITAAQGARELWSRGKLTGGIAALVLVVWAGAEPVHAYPDYLAFFNALAGDQPQRILVDSNLDWGQDLYRLRDTLAARRIGDSVKVAYFGTADLAAAGVPRARLLGLHERATGWIAASETYLAGEWVGGAYAWLLDYPSVARIGPSMRLWHIPDIPLPTRPTGVTTDSSQR
jgi:4-amino-4-deoxy-L-arabinose transferase-like glycosyltransferase